MFYFTMFLTKVIYIRIFRCIGQASHRRAHQYFLVSFRSNVHSDIRSDIPFHYPIRYQLGHWNEWLLLCRLIEDLWAWVDTFKQKYLWSCLAKVKGRLKWGLIGQEGRRLQRLQLWRSQNATSSGSHNLSSNWTPTSLKALSLESE